MVGGAGEGNPAGTNSFTFGSSLKFLIALKMVVEGGGDGSY